MRNIFKTLIYIMLVISIILNIILFKKYSVANEGVQYNYQRALNGYIDELQDIVFNDFF